MNSSYPLGDIPYSFAFFANATKMPLMMLTTIAPQKAPQKPLMEKPGSSQAAK